MSESSPLLARNSVTLYTSDDVTNETGGNQSEPEATRPCRSLVSGVDTDAEYGSSASRCDTLSSHPIVRNLA